MKSLCLENWLLLFPQRTEKGRHMPLPFLCASDPVRNMRAALAGRTNCRREIRTPTCRFKACCVTCFAMRQNIMDKRPFCAAWATPAFQDLCAFLIHLIHKWRHSRRWRRHKDSNLGAAFATCRFSKPVPSAPWVCLRMVAGAGVEPAASEL